MPDRYLAPCRCLSGDTWIPLASRVIALFVFLLLGWPAAHAGTQTGGAGQVVHLLDYLAVDYAEAVANGQVRDAGEYAEMKEFAGNVGHLIATLPGPDEAVRRTLATDALKLASRIEARADAPEIARLASQLKRQVVLAWSLRLAPKRAPDLRRGAALFAEHCAACHGTGGRGDGPSATGLDPSPSNFLDRGRMARRSLHGLYNTIALGVEGTAMAAWPQLTEDDRWALAFFVGGLAATRDELLAGEARWLAAGQTASIRDLSALSSVSAQELGSDAPLLAWLTRHPDLLETRQEAPLTVARRLLAESVAALTDGRREDARRLAVAAYLDGFEPGENGLDQVDHRLRVELEAELMAFRQHVASGNSGVVAERAKALDARLALAAEKMADTRLSPTAAGLSAFGILFREGLEAILVLAALGAGVVRSTGSRTALRYIHAGWVAALLAGFATWLIAEQLVAISGAARETTEGVTALVSAGILLYVGLWLHGKAHADHWTRFLDQRVSGALTRGKLGLLAGASFLAVYREAFETVLFYQALAAQAVSADLPIALGATVAALTLVLLAWAVFRGGLRLPIGVFFRVSAALLALLAVIFAGQGVAALQEAGGVGADPVSFVRWPLLGVYPTVQTLGAQGAAIALVLASLFWQRRVSGAR